MATRGPLRLFTRLLSSIVLVALIFIPVVYYFDVSGRNALKVWHLTNLNAEFRAADASRIANLDDYRRNEDVIFSQLADKIYSEPVAGELQLLNRYSSGSPSDVRASLPDWNRTVELRHNDPRGAAVLIHGLTDSPYVMRALAEKLHAGGYWVVALRLPGHGTTPSGLIHADWQDWAAAVRLATKHVGAKVGRGRPLILVGLSTGAALSVEYALSRLHGEDVPEVAGLVLLSPAIGVSPKAALARWQSKMAAVPGLEGFAWIEVSPEYDPYRYVSFAVHSADQIYRLTRRIQELLELGKPTAGVSGLPRILAFQSVADATVSTPAVVDAFFRRLAPDGHQLVLFDINRHSASQHLFTPASLAALAVREKLLKDQALPFDLTVLTNAAADSIEIVALRQASQSQNVTREAIGLKWPDGVFSLSHVALPMPPDDPIYGAVRPIGTKLIYLGRMELLGENGFLAVSSDSMLRIRHNPFFSYVSKRLDTYIDEIGK